LNAASMVAIEAVARAATSADGTATVEYNSLGGMSLPTGADGITGYSNGQVAININSNYPEVANLVNDLAGGRVTSCTVGDKTKCMLNTLAGTKTSGSTTTDTKDKDQQEAGKTE